MWFKVDFEIWVDRVVTEVVLLEHWIVQLCTALLDGLYHRVSLHSRNLRD